MGILNATPDSFSDGGLFDSVEAAVKHADTMIADGADVIDIGGESTRPGSMRVTARDEVARVVPIIKAIVTRFDTPISVDTSKPAVAEAAVDAGAEIINDISGLRWEPSLADIAAKNRAGIIVMHSRGDFETMHSFPPAEDIVPEVISSLAASIQAAKDRGVNTDQIALDVGIGFGKTVEQNLELLARLARITSEFKEYPMLVGTSRKSFIGKVLDEADPSKRVGGSIASALSAIERGARIVRVHDVKEMVSAIRVWERINRAGRD